MKVIEILKLGGTFLNLLHDSCVRMDDLRFVPLYDEYCRIVRSGGKTTYAVAYLSEKYNVSERKVYYLIRKFGSDCKIGAEG